MIKLRQILAFFRLTDASGALSLTNLWVYAAMAIAVAAPTLQVPHLVAVMLTLFNYAAKKVIDIRAAHTAALNAQATSLEATNKMLIETAKQVESIKAKLNLSQAFGKQ